jgi:hypothetical protein
MEHAGSGTIWHGMRRCASPYHNSTTEKTLSVGGGDPGRGGAEEVDPETKGGEQATLPDPEVLLRKLLSGAFSIIETEGG